MENFNIPIIVSMTSWKKRIINVKYVVSSILQGTKKPDKIILNLSTDEFQDKHIPIDLKLLEKYTIFEINWVKENTKAFKKIIPTMELYPNSIIISIDDDIIYPRLFIETILDSYKKQNKDIITLYRNKNKYEFDSVVGCGTLYTTSKLVPFISNHLNKEIINTNEDDTYYAWCAKHLNLSIGWLYNNMKESKIRFFNEIEPMGGRLYKGYAGYNICKKYFDNIKS
jgi:hypothetical protein